MRRTFFRRRERANRLETRSFDGMIHFESRRTARARVKWRAYAGCGFAREAACIRGAVALLARTFPTFIHGETPGNPRGRHGSRAAPSSTSPGSSDGGGRKTDGLGSSGVAGLG